MSENGADIKNIWKPDTISNGAKPKSHMSREILNLYVMKSKLVAFLLWFFLGSLSMHRFYLGKVGSGILYLLTGQLLGIGWIVDLFLLSGMVDNYNNKKEIQSLKK